MLHKKIPIVWDGTIAADFSQGDGQRDNPYLLACPSELALLAKRVNDGESFSGKYFALMNDFDLDSLDWTPIGGGNTFDGTFRGNGHLITRLNCNMLNQDDDVYAGLFGSVGTGGVVLDMILGGTVQVKAAGQSARAGAVAGRNLGEISVCVAEDIKIECSGQPTFEKAVSMAGGIAGENHGRIYNCAASGSITAQAVSFAGASAYAGGLAGFVPEGSEIINSYANADISAMEYAGMPAEGPFAGGAAGFATGKYGYCAWNQNTSQKIGHTPSPADLKDRTDAEKLGAGNVPGSNTGGKNDSPNGGMGYTSSKLSAQIEEISFFDLLNTYDSGYLWSYDIYGVNNGLPVPIIKKFQSGTRFVLASTEDFVQFSREINSGGFCFDDTSFDLTADVDLGGLCWIPIGSGKYSNAVFAGEFNGGWRTITNLSSSIVSTFTTEAGLFSSIGKDAVIRRLTLDNAKISVKIAAGELSAGILTGINRGAICDCCVNGEINVQFVEAELFSLATGSVAGQNTETARIEDCSSSVSLQFQLISPDSSVKKKGSRDNVPCGWLGGQSPPRS